MKDILSDVLDRIAKMLGKKFPDHLRRQIEEQVRSDWGGDKHHVMKVNTTSRQHRDQQIIDAWRAGKPTDLIAVKFRISERRVRQIINRRNKIQR